MVAFPVSSPFTEFTEVDKGQLDVLVDAINVLPRGFLNGVYDPTTIVTLNGGIQNAKAGGAQYTFTLTERRRMTFWVVARFIPGTTSAGRYFIHAAVNPGSSANVGSAQYCGAPQSVRLTPAAAGDGSSESGNAYGTLALDPGTYTVYPAIERANGGDDSDTAANFQTTVQDGGDG